MNDDRRPAPAAPRPAVFAGMCAALLALNPLTYALHRVSGGLLPDSIAYLAFGKAWLASGALHLDGWSHVDAGLILPPLYPSLVALLGALTGDPMAASYAVCTGALLLATVPLLFVAWRLAGPVAGVLALAVLQAHPLVLEFGASALTEAPFVLLLAAGLCLLLSHNDRPAAWKAVALGLLAALLFFTRQIGGFFWPLAAALVALRALADAGAARGRAALAPALLVTAGFAALLLPYAIALHAQTGQGPLTQSFRQMRYVVAPPEGFAPPAAQADVYAQRREQRQLLPDASEMVMWTRGATAAEKPPLADRLAVIPRNLRGNVALLRQSLGTPALVLLALALLSPLAARGHGPAQWARWLLPATLLAYLAALSLFTGMVLRYAHVLVPLAVLQVFAETAWLLRRLPAAAPRLVATGIAVALAAALVASLPKKSWSVTLSPRIGERGNPLAACARQVPAGAPVYAFHPLGAYLLNGTYRVIPNDALDRVVHYAGATGVRHMLLTVLPFEQAEMAYYHHAPWIEDLLRLDRRDPRIKVQCRTDDGVAVLYAIEPGPARD